MKVSVEISVLPMGTEPSVSPYIAECQRVLEKAGLKPQLHAWGTNVEGDWDTVFDAVRQCHEAVHAMGAPRIVSNLKVGSRTDKQQSLEDKVEAVRRLR